MSDKDEIVPQVETRIKEEKRKKSSSKKEKVKKIEPSFDDISVCLYENRLGDAKLYAHLCRGQVVYVKHWERFLVWGGHHWIEDDYELAFQKIEEVCALYLVLQDEKKALLKDEDDKDMQAVLQHVIDTITRRINSLRDKTGMENLLTMVRRIKDPLIVLPKQIDRLHYEKACPNGVIDLRTGELRDGKPTDYLLNAIVTEYDPRLLEVDDPCPATNAFLLSSMDGDHELVQFIWRLLGYGLITERRDHIFTIFWGEHGRNGKDTLIKLITRVLGQNLSGDKTSAQFIAQGLWSVDVSQCDRKSRIGGALLRR